MATTKQKPAAPPSKRVKPLEEVLRENLNTVTVEVATRGCEAIDQLATGVANSLKRALLGGLSK